MDNTTIIKKYLNAMFKKNKINYKFAFETTLAHKTKTIPKPKRRTFPYKVKEQDPWPVDPFE